ncbi:MAG: hypothetical protein ACD_65C00174G0001 [uncultured bacterium]|nr:MAG: hypothetical protein ACD_65C00174G0001 [uncultured bacterium]
MFDSFFSSYYAPYFRAYAQWYYFAKIKSMIVRVQGALGDFLYLVHRPLPDPGIGRSLFYSAESFPKSHEYS